MNILKKLRGREEEGETTIKKEMNIVSKRLSNIASEIKSSNQDIFYLKDYEFREDSIWCLMTKSLADFSEIPKIIWVSKIPSKLILKRQYMLINFEDIGIEKQEKPLLSSTATCFADEMILC